MNLRIIFRIVFSLLAVSGFFISAVSATKPARVVLPNRLVAGQPATLAVVDADGQLLADVAVTFTGAAQVTTDQTGRAIFTAPGQQGILFAEARNGEGSARGSAVVVLASTQRERGMVADAPSVISLATEFSLSGSGFRGEADENEVTLGGKPAIVLAASPASLVIVPAPEVAPGPSELEIATTHWRSGPLKVTLVSLEVNAEPTRVAPRQKGKLTIRARGIELPVEIVLTNHTPDILELPEAETRLRMQTRGGTDNIAVVEVKGRREGDFAVEVRLVPSAAGLPDTVLAHRELTKAHGIATGELQKTIARLMRHMEEHPQHYLDVRNELERILADLPRGEMLLHVEAAWRALLKK